ncbi:hypothetical protein ACFL4Z_03815, partial [candidate division KSB1 bacterium]
VKDKFYPIGGGKGSPEFEERLNKIKKILAEKNYKVTQNDIEVRKDVISIWNCPPEEKLKPFVDAIFDLLKTIEYDINADLSINFPPASKVKDLERIIKPLWDIKKYSVIRELTDSEINGKLLSYYGDGKSKIFAGDAYPRSITNLEQELYVNNLYTDKIQGAKFISVFSNIDVKETIQKVEKLKADKLKCGGMRFCGKYSEEELIENEILIKNILCEGSVENSYVSFGSEKSNDILKAQNELEEKKRQTINSFNDKAVIVRRQIITDNKFGLEMKDKKWIKHIFEQAQKNYKKSVGRESILDYLVDFLTQQHNDVFVGEVKIVNGKKYKQKREMATLKSEKIKILQKMDELKENMRKREEEIALYKEKISKEYWVKKLYLKKPFGEFWLEQLKSTFGDEENYREILRKLFGKFVGITTSIEIFDNCPDYHNLLTIYRAFSIIHKEMTKKLIEFITKNKEYTEYLAGDAAVAKEPNFVTNSLNNSVVRLDYNDFSLIKGMISNSKIFGGTHNRIVVLGNISESNFVCDDISVKGSIDKNSKIVTKCLTAERCSIGIKISTGPGSRILIKDKEYLEEYEFKNFGSNVILSEVPGRHNVYELSFS